MGEKKSRDTEDTFFSVSGIDVSKWEAACFSDILFLKSFKCHNVYRKRWSRRDAFRESYTTQSVQFIIKNTGR